MLQRSSLRPAVASPSWRRNISFHLATTTRWQLLVRGQFKEPGFCLLCSRCLPVRGWAPKENRKQGLSRCAHLCMWPVYTEAHFRELVGHFWIWKRNITDIIKLLHVFHRWRWFGVISDLSISSSKNNTLMLTVTDTLHARFLGMGFALEDWDL